MHVLEQLSDAIDAVVAAEPARLADRESILALHRQLERLEAATTRATAAFEAGGTWEADGARSAAAWLATRVPHARCPRPGGACAWGGRCGTWPMPRRPGWRVTSTPPTWPRWPRRARRRARTASGATRRCWCDQAARLSHRHFSRALAYWCQHADPDGTEDRAAAELRRPAPAPVPELRRQLGARRGLRSHRRRGARPARSRRIEAGAVRRRLGRGPGPGGRGGLRGRSGPHPRPAPGRRAWWRWPAGRGRCPPAPGCPSRCSPCWWAMRPSPGASASWPTAPWSAPGACCPGWMRRGWNGWCSTGPTG